MITIRQNSLGACYPCGDMGGRSPGISGLRGIKRGALGALAFLGADGPTAEEVAMASSGTPNTDGSAFIDQWGRDRRAELMSITATQLVVGSVIMAAGAGLAGYHGYKRSGGKIGSTLGWGFLGGLIPIVTVPVALAQGFGKRKGR